MTDEQDRIRLCEWQGLFKSDPDIETVNGIPQKRSVRAWLKRPGKCLPDPKHNPADCEALIDHLVARGYLVRVCRGPVEASVRAWNDETSVKWFGKDYKTGVVELALKIRDGEDDAR